MQQTPDAFDTSGDDVENPSEKNIEYGTYSFPNVNLNLPPCCLYCNEKYYPQDDYANSTGIPEVNFN